MVLLSAKLGGVIIGFCFRECGETVPPTARFASTSPAGGGGNQVRRSCKQLVRDDLPLNLLAAAVDERALFRAVYPDVLGRGPAHLFKRDCLRVGGQTVMFRA